MPTREEKKQSEELQDIMKDKAEKAVSDEIEKIKSEIKKGRTKYDQSKIKKRLEEVSKNAVDAVIAQASGSLGIIKSGEYYYPIVPQPSLVVWIPAAVGLAKLAAVGIAALAAGEGIKELDEWYHSTYEVEGEGEVAERDRLTSYDERILTEAATTFIKNSLMSQSKAIDQAVYSELLRTDPSKITQDVLNDKVLEEAQRRVDAERFEREVEKTVREIRPPRPKKEVVVEWIRSNWSKLVSQSTTALVFEAGALFIPTSIVWYKGISIPTDKAKSYAFEISSIIKDIDSAITYKDYDLAENKLKTLDKRIDEFEKYIDKHHYIISEYETNIPDYREEYDRLAKRMESTTGSSLVGRTVTGKVVRVNDGDSFAMELDDTGKYITIRVNHLNCPEEGARKGNLDLYKFCKDIAEDTIYGEHVTAKITGITSGWGNTIRYMADVSFSGGDFATVMKRDTSGECV